jgi:prepilin-type N-terminal cleavage/methylation domain-containing protein
MEKINKNGFTIIESMLAIVILLMMAVAGGAFFFYSTARISVESNKRVAIEAANTRLEKLKSSDYENIKPAQDASLHYIKAFGTGWVLDGVNDETIDINGTILPITTTLQYIDAHNGGDPYDFLHVVVSVGYHLANPAEQVVLETYLGP